MIQFLHKNWIHQPYCEKNISESDWTRFNRFQLHKICITGRSLKATKLILIYWIDLSNSSLRWCFYPHKHGRWRFRYSVTEQSFYLNNIQCVNKQNWYFLFSRRMLVNIIKLVRTHTDLYHPYTISYETIPRLIRNSEQNVNQNRLTRS